MSERRVVIVGGGAAGFFGAIVFGESAPATRVTLLEKSAQFLSKVRISGGGRCNVTHACFDPGELVTRYPRGAAELRGPFRLFQPKDTVAWFESRGVPLKTEPDGRIFPVSDSSQTIIGCLLHAARDAGVETVANCGLETVVRVGDRFRLTLSNGEATWCDQLMLATGGCRVPAAGEVPVSLGHTLEPPVPSLFTFEVPVPWLRELAGISVKDVEVSIPGFRLRERGPILITHRGLSGPVVLRLSAWGARPLHDVDYRFTIRIHWLPDLKPDGLTAELARLRAMQSAKRIVNTPLAPLPARLWERLVLLSAIPRETRWSGLSGAERHALVQQLSGTHLEISGKSLNKEEFVTCGGVRLREVDFRTLQSRVCPGLYFGGELLDIDGVTGGFNFQAAWTTGWIAGRAMANSGS